MLSTLSDEARATGPHHVSTSFDAAAARRLCISVADLRDAASARMGGVEISTAQPPAAGFAVDKSVARAALMRRRADVGTSEMLNFADELFLACTDWRSVPSDRRPRWEFDLGGWLYLHFRLDGSSAEESPSGVRTGLDGQCFVLSASSHPRPFVRELLGDAWRTVGIMCRLPFATHELQVPQEALPQDLQRLQSGEQQVVFWHADRLTREMRWAAESLLQPQIRAGMRSIYLRAKTVELVCLALERLCEAESGARRPLRLTPRDIQCLHEARRLLNEDRPVPSLEQLARGVGINRRKLALGFKQIFGRTVGEYCRERRLELARNLLESTACSIAYVASRVGYADAGSFTKAFRAHFGYVPSEPPDTRRK